MVGLDGHFFLSLSGLLVSLFISKSEAHTLLSTLTPTNVNIVQSDGVRFQYGKQINVNKRKLLFLYIILSE